MKTAKEYIESAKKNKGHDRRELNLKIGDMILASESQIKQIEKLEKRFIRLEALMESKQTLT